MADLWGPEARERARREAQAARYRVVAENLCRHEARERHLSFSSVWNSRQGRPAEARVEVYRQLQVLGWSAVEIAMAFGRSRQGICGALAKAQEAKAAE